jgi:polyhydroxybutyrate depolymerase
MRGDPIGHLAPFAVLCLVVVAACGASTASATPPPTPSGAIASTLPTPSAGPWTSGSLTVNGQMRRYTLYRPPSIDPSQLAPLVMLLHPCPGAADQTTVAASHFDDQATAGRFFAVWPQGSNGCWNAGSCCTGADDVTFVSQLIDSLAKDLPINRARVFVAGLSNGASMAYRLACELSSKIAGIASVSGAMLVGSCHPTRPVSILIMHGTADDVFPYDGGGQYGAPSVASVVKQWTTLDGCRGTAAQTESGITKTSEWHTCTAGAVIKVETIAGGAHAWFGFNDPSPLPNEPQASTEVWRFFSQVQPGA